MARPESSGSRLPRSSRLTTSSSRSRAPRTQRGKAYVGSRATRTPPMTSPVPSRPQRSSMSSSTLSAGVTSSGRIEVAAENVAAACELARVKQIVYLGGLGDDDPTASPHLRSRRETGERLSAGAVPVTTLRAAMIVGRGSAAFETIVALVDRLPAMITPSWVSTPTQPIALADVSHYLAGCVRQSCCARRELRCRRARGDDLPPDDGADRGPPARPAAVDPRVPVLTPRLSSLWLHLVTPVGASVARPLIEGLKSPTIAREERRRTLVPFELTSFDDAARLAFGR